VSKIINQKFLVSLVLLVFMLLTGCQQTQEPEPTPVPSSDLIFAPAEVQVAPGLENSVSVQVASGADLSSATFGLEGVIDDMSVSFEPSEDNKAGELFVSLSDTIEGSRDVTIKGTDGEHTWFGSLKVTASVTAPVTRFVNPTTGKDTNPGTQAAPFKTLFKALSVSTSSDTIRLAKGVYSQATNGEKYTQGDTEVLVPAGVTIVGALDLAKQRVSVLEGATGVTALRFQGSGTVKNLVLKGFVDGIQASQGKQVLSNLEVTQTDIGISLIGSAQTTLQNSIIRLDLSNLNTFNEAVGVSDSAQFVMDGGLITGGKANCNLEKFGVGVFDTGKATLKNGAVLENIANGALDGFDSATMTVDRSIIRRKLPSGCEAKPNVKLFNSASLKFIGSALSNSGAGSVGVSALKDASLTFDGASVSGFQGGGSVAISVTDNVKLSINSSSISANDIGIKDTGNANGRITVTNSTFSFNDIGILTPFAKLRNTHLTNNDTGIMGTGNFLDLGQVGDPGGNTIQDNTITGVTFNFPGGLGGAFAVGNTWTPFTQGADGSGHYPANTTINSFDPRARGTNFDMTGNFSIQF
jgi:hypothetical protein